MTKNNDIPGDYQGYVPPVGPEGATLSEWDKVEVQAALSILPQLMVEIERSMRDVIEMDPKDPAYDRHLIDAALRMHLVHLGFQQFCAVFGELAKARQAGKATLN